MGSEMCIRDRLGMKFVLAAPGGHDFDAAFLAAAAKAVGRTPDIEMVRDPHRAVRNAQILYTDVWASMGQEEEADERRKAFEPYQVNGALVARASAGALIMHDLPAHRGEEITDDVMDSANSIVFDQAENRLHVQKGVMVFLCQANGV